MIETKDLTKFAQHVFSHGRGLSRAPALYPEREWFVITMLFLVVFLTGAVLSVWYYQVYQDLPNQVSGREAVSVPSYQAAAVSRAHEMYAEREEQYKSLYTAAVDADAGMSITASSSVATSSVAELDLSADTATQTTATSSEE